MILITAAIALLIFATYAFHRAHIYYGRR